jgi:hypothetical protein
MTPPQYTPWKALLVVIPALAGPAAGESLIPTPPPDRTPRAQLERALHARGAALLQARRDAVAAIHTREQLEARRAEVRSAVLDLMGGLPAERAPLHARVTGRHDGPGFTVENVVFESLPGFRVTANVYRPTSAAGRLPAVVASMGHHDLGKAAERLGPDLARHGFLVLQYDPVGLGERLQHYDPELRASKAGGSTDEHGQAAARAELVGLSVARYFVWDAMRALDYLETRGDVDRDKLAAVGCSGGGTATTYLAALDPRVKAAAIACYVTSWDALLQGPGPQEAEQTLAGFLARGLDMGDWLALIAPRPLLIVSTEGDFFPLAGAQAVYEEARRLYDVAGAADRIAWASSPGPHGISPEGRVSIAAFFLQAFPTGAKARDLPDARLDPEDLACTETGQVVTLFAGRTLADLIRADAGRSSGPRPRAASREAVVAAATRAVGMDGTSPRTAPVLAVHRSVPRGAYRLDVVSFDGGDGVDVFGLLAVPEGEAGSRAVLLADPRVRAEGGDVGGDLDVLASAGRTVLALELRGTLTEVDPAPRASLLGPLVGLFRRASAVGTSLVSLRAQDVLRGVDVLAARGAREVDVYGRGAFAVPALHAAVLDRRVARVAVQDAPVSYRVFLDHPIHRDLPEILVPGVLRDYDLPDLARALFPRTVLWMNPTDAVGKPMKPAEAQRYAGGASGREGGVQVARRGRGEPIRWE